MNPALAQLVLTPQDCGGVSLTLCATKEATGPREGNWLAALGLTMSQDGGATTQGSWSPGQCWVTPHPTFLSSQGTV